MEDIISYYQGLGAPADQTALVSMLREIQQLHGGIPVHLVSDIAQAMQIKETYSFTHIIK